MYNLKQCPNCYDYAKMINGNVTARNVKLFCAKTLNKR